MDINTLLINEEYVKKYSTVSDNLDSKLITPAIMGAQLEWLQPILGTNLFDRLCGLVKDGTITAPENANYKTLLDDYVATGLMYAAIADITIENFQRIHNAGSVQYVDTNYQQIALNELKFTKAHWDEKANFYANRLAQYLHANHELFPEYCACRDGADMHSDTASATYNCGIHLGRPYYKKKRKDR